MKVYRISPFALIWQFVATVIGIGIVYFILDYFLVLKPLSYSVVFYFFLFLFH
ncbi:hypothetical protein GMA11_07040 [Granulicatella sp. zg-ZJ]|uniref:hypothetical protein n=1 Tax=Granulicatella sp. zg-ZJ TaxID=2678504 RepID=UPI0013D443AD|nr:hypothetical protein [Granulicatella sp. zg-ZJ]NEW62152.1 hypothetical protein [Granulicatella sp. zg-ZJ]NEW63149.1 hypothetical protein [Granulicatella sp. zg-ZJ]